MDATTDKRETKHDTSVELQAQNELRLLLASAMVEYIDPMSFGQELMSESAYEQALVALAESCDEVEHANNWHWVLKQDVRRAVLQKHYGSELYESVRANVKSLDTDTFANYFKKGMDGFRLSDELNKNDDTAIDFNALLRAARLIDLLGIPTNDGHPRAKDNGSGEVPSEARQIRRHIEKKAAMDSLGGTAGERLFGRQRDVRALIRYRNTNLIDRRNEALRLCVIIGVGGIGKSALLARYIARQRNHKEQAPVIHFDFDRSSLKPDDPLALTFEFTRQLALYEPELDLPLVRFRRSLRTPEAVDEVNKIPGRALTEALAILGKNLADWPGRTSGITIVIDTFEEVVLQGNHAVKETLYWLKCLRDLARLDNMHVIIAGREMPDSILSENLPHIHCRIRLSDLHKGAAKLMLIHLGIDASVATKAVETFGGNPLVLRMFVRFFNNKPEEIDALLTDSRNHVRSAPLGKLALTFLFERILVRIQDERIRKLTSPGLLLRHITADLIEHVLAEACDLGQLNSEQSQELFDKLAEHVWLVRQEGDRLLSHRRDLRRMMLPGIHKAHESSFERINQLAVDYYTSQPEGVSVDEAWIEAAYHRGFLSENPIPLTVEDARNVITQLGSDLMDWPVHTSAMIKQRAMPERLTFDEKQSLEATHGLISRVSEAARIEQTESREPSITEHTNNTKQIGTVALDASLLYLDAQAMSNESIHRHFKTGRFDHISPLATQLVQPLFRQREALDRTHFWNDDYLLQKPPWLAALSVLAEPDWHSDNVPIIPPVALDAVQATPRRVAMDTTFELFYMLSIAEIMQDRLAIDSLSSFLRSHLPCFAPSITTSAQLQVLKLSIKAINTGDLIGDRDLIAITDCDMLQWRSVYKALSDNTHPDTNINRDRLAAIRDLLPVEDKPPSLKQQHVIREALKEHAVEVLGPAGLNELHCIHRELYDPICFALESVPAHRMYDALKSMSYESSQWWPTELSPDHIVESTRKTFDPRVIRTIVETADRCNILEHFLMAISQNAFAHGSVAQGAPLKGTFFRGEEDPLIRDELRLLQRLTSCLND